MSPLENFKNFLMVKGCLQNYLLNIKNQRGYDFEDIVHHVGPDLRGVINNTMHWAGTPEPNGFWMSIDRDWNKAVDSGELFISSLKSIW